MRLHKGDILQASWSGQEIGVLHVDAAKSVQLAQHVAREFFSRLKPGAVVIMQDYLSPRHAWCIRLMETLGDNFAFAGATQVNAALFVCLNPVDRDEAAIATLGDATDAEYIESVARASAILPGPNYGRQLAKHIAQIEDNPGARHISEFKSRKPSDARIRRAAKDHGLERIS